MTNADGVLCPRGKGKVAEDGNLPQNFRSGRKRNTFTTVAGFIPALRY